MESFFEHYPSKTYKPGQVILHAGDQPTGIFYLESGVVRQFTLSKEGVERTLNLYKPGSFFPMSFALNQTPNRHSFEVVAAAQVRIAPAAAVVDFLKANPDIAFDLLQRMFKALDGLLLQIEHRTSGDAYDILLTTLVLLARRFGRQSETGTQIEVSLTHAILAAQAGLSRETVSRTLQKYKTKGLLSFTSRIVTIPDLAVLEAEIEA